MKQSREEAANNLERIDSDGSGIVYLEDHDTESLRMGAEALRKLNELEAWAKAWQNYYWEQWKTVRKYDFIARQDAYAYMGKAINETLPGPPGGTDEP